MVAYSAAHMGEVKFKKRSNDSDHNHYGDYFCSMAIEVVLFEPYRPKLAESEVLSRIPKMEREGGAR